MMKQALFLAAITLSIATVSCKSNSLSGVYICDASQKKADTTITHETHVESFIDITCVVSELDFKGNSSVLIKFTNGQLASSYVIDKDYVRIKGDKGDMLFKIIDGNTIKSEGDFPHGTYHKK